VSAGQASLADRIAGLESRCLALEDPAARAPSGSPSSSVVDDLASRLRGFERSQRDHELIIFGLPDVDGDRSHLLRSLAAVLEVEFSHADIADSMRIRSNRSASRPLVIRFISVTRRNEWLAAARRRRGISARCVRESWPEDRIGIYERSTAAERGALAEARLLARDYGIKHIWMRRGTIYFKTSDVAYPRRYSSPDSFARADLFAVRSDPSSASAPPSGATSREVAISPI